MKPNFKPPLWLVTLSFSILVAQLFSQNINNKPSYRFALKAYLSISNENMFNQQTNADGNIITNRQNNTYILPAIGFVKQKKKGAFFEIGLTHFSFSQEDSKTDYQLLFQRDSLGKLVPSSGINIPTRGAKTNTAYVGLRFEWNFPVFYEKMGRFQPFIGVSTDPSVYFLRIDPFTTATFLTTKIEANNTFTIIPRLIFNASSRLFFDVNIPVSVFSMTGTYNRYDNPILPTYAREAYDFSSKFFPPQLNIRLGVGYRI